MRKLTLAIALIGWAGAAIAQGIAPTPRINANGRIYFPGYGGPLAFTTDIVNGSYLGNWDASANNPALTTNPGPNAPNGSYYIVSVGGTQTVTGSSDTFNPQDQLKSTGSAWVHVANVVNKNTVGLGNVQNVDQTNANNLTSGTLSNARIPAPTSSALGGIMAATAPINQFQTGVTVGGAPIFTTLTSSNIAAALGGTPVTTTTPYFTTSVYAPGLTIGNSGAGYVQLVTGDASDTGFISFNSANYSRMGYIGSGYGTIIPIVASSGNHFDFEGGLPPSIAGVTIAVTNDYRLNAPRYLVGAAGNGVTDDTSAISNSDAGGPTTIQAGNFRVASNLAINNDVVFLSGARLVPDSGVTITLNGQVTAADKSQIFGGSGTVVVANAPRVSVAWWGAIGAADAAPAFNAAGGSNRQIIVPPGSYTFCSVRSVPSSDGAAFDPEAVIYRSFTSLRFTAYGATMTMCPNVSTSPTGSIVFVRGTGLVVEGGTHIGTKVGAPANSENNAIGLVSVQDFTVKDVTCGSGFGGIGSCLGGDWMMNGRFENIRADTVGIMADVAFLKNVVFDGIRAKGAGDNGSGLGQTGISLKYDPPNTNYNVMNFPITDSDGVVVQNSDISNFNTGNLIASGKNEFFINNKVHDNPGSGSSGGIGYYILTGVSGFAPGNISIVGGSVSNNGGTVAGAGIGITSPASASDAITGITVSGVMFSNNSSYDVSSGGSSTNINNVVVTGPPALLDSGVQNLVGKTAAIGGPFVAGGQLQANQTNKGVLDFYGTNNAARVMSYGTSTTPGNIEFWSAAAGATAGRLAFLNGSGLTLNPSGNYQMIMSYDPVGASASIQSTNSGVANTPLKLNPNGGQVIIGGAGVNLSPYSPSGSSACTYGQVAVDASYIYVCVAANTWKRSSALSAF